MIRLSDPLLRALGYDPTVPSDRKCAERAIQPVPTLVGTVVEALGEGRSPIGPGREFDVILLRFADGRLLRLTPIGWETEGVEVEELAAHPAHPYEGG